MAPRTPGEPSFHVAIFFDDGTLLQYKEVDELPDLEGMRQQAPTARRIIYRGTRELLVQEPGDYHPEPGNPRLMHRPGAIIWYEEGVEIRMQGEHSGETFIRLADSIIQSDA